MFKSKTKYQKPLPGQHKKSIYGLLKFGHKCCPWTGHQIFININIFSMAIKNLNIKEKN